MSDRDGPAGTHGGHDLAAVTRNRLVFDKSFLAVAPGVLLRRSEEIGSSSALSRSGRGRRGRGQVFVVFFVLYRVVFGRAGGDGEFDRVGIRAAGGTHGACVVGAGRRDRGGHDHHASAFGCGRGRDGGDEFVVLMIHGLVIAIIGPRGHVMNWGTVFLLTKKLVSLYFRKLKKIYQYLVIGGGN